MIVLEVLVLVVLGFFNFLVGIPLGYAFGLSTATIYVASMVGCVGGTVGLVFVGDRLLPPLKALWNAVVRRVVRRVLPGRAEGAAADIAADADAPVARSRRSEFIRALTERHGGIALGLIGPVVIGGPAAALLGVALGLRKRELAIGLAISLSVMVTLFMVLVHAALR